MKMLRTLLGVLPVLVVVSCATPAYVERDEQADFSRYKSFAWIDNSNKEGKNQQNEFLKNNVQEAVNAKLVKEGWKEDRRNPDVLLSYDMLVERATREVRDPVYSQPYSRIFYNPYTRRYGRIFYPSTFLGNDNYSVSVREGTLTITMLDAKSDKTIWQGWTTDEVKSRNVTKKEVQASVNSIFRKFDVATR